MTKQVFPAPAGVIPNPERPEILRSGFPRTCGGDPEIQVDRKSEKQFSPHLRG